MRKYVFVLFAVLAFCLVAPAAFAQATGQPKFQIFPEGPRDFFFKVVDAQITFQPDASGRATSLTLHQNGANVPAKRIP